MVRNPFHLVEFSPWPIVGFVGAFFLTVGLASWMHSYGMVPICVGILIILITMLQWWRDVIREGTYQGYHTYQVSVGLRWGMLLFITSEVLFFFAFFWVYFHSSLAPTLEVGACWPPVGVDFLNPLSVPLLNTAVLLASGVSVTWAHHSGLSDGVFGTVFYVATGFHGLHVLIGSSFLIVCLVRTVFFHFSDGHHFGFEAAAWYWHFVDVVWLFLYLCIYWWGS